jgi:hypothetical protein
MNMRTPFAALAILMTVSAPALAQQLDGGALTCAEYNAMDAAGKNIAMGAIRAFAKESVNAEASGMVAQMDTDDDVAYMGRMDASCIDAVGTTAVIDAMQTTN